MPESISKIMKDSVCSEESLSILTNVLEEHANIELLEEIPFVSYAVSFLKIVDFARNRWLLRKMAIFIQSVNLNQISEKERQKALEHFEQDEEKQKEELEYLILILDKYLEEDKSVLLARVYVEFIKGNISSIQLKIFAEIIGRFLPGDFETLEEGEKDFKTYQDISASVLRISSLGLMQKISRFITDAAQIKDAHQEGTIDFQSATAISPYENGGVYKYTSLGLLLRSILFPEIEASSGIIKIDNSRAIFMM